MIIFGWLCSSCQYLCLQQSGGSGVAALESSAHVFICRPGWLQDDICIPLRCGSLPRPGRSRCRPLHQGSTAPPAPRRPCAGTQPPAGQAPSPGHGALVSQRVRRRQRPRGLQERGGHFPHCPNVTQVPCLVRRSRLPLHSRAPGVSSDCHMWQMGLNSSAPLAP